MEEAMTSDPRPAGLLLLTVLAVAGSGCVINLDADQVVVREEKQFSVSAGAEVTVETFDGSIQVMAWDQPQVRVEAEKRGPDREVAAALEVRATQEGNRIRIEAPAPKVTERVVGFGNTTPSVSFIIRVPANVKLGAMSRDGSITVEGVHGPVNLRSNDGSIRARAIVGELVARTNDGSVAVDEVNGPVSLDTGDGSIRVDGRLLALHAKTSDGSITINAGEGSAMKGDWDVSTGDGSITLRVPQGFSAEVDANSDDGRVSSDFKELEAVRDESDRSTMRGRIGSGGHKLTLRSGDGSISLTSR
jgi:DUF4097 and DUF4098 domain-containing protein YvlB